MPRADPPFGAPRMNGRLLQNGTHKADIAPAATASQRLRTERSARYGATVEVRRQVSTPQGAYASARRLVNGDAEVEFPRFQVRPY